MIVIESQIRLAIRDAVNRNSRKPFYWGGLSGYEQLEAIVQGLHQIQGTEQESDYLRLLSTNVERVLQKNRTIAEDLKVAQQQLRQVAQCLRMPSKQDLLNQNKVKVSSTQVSQEMEALIHGFCPTGKLQRAQKGLYHAFKKRWERYAQELLYCYDIPGLPQDNLQLESLFGRLRRHQRRISGRKTTQELNVFGQAQVLFMAKSIEELLLQIQLVPSDVYFEFRNRLAEAELPRQFFRRLHHDPLAAIQALVRRHSLLSQSLIKYEPPTVR